MRDSPYADIAGGIVATMFQPFLQTDTNRGMMVLHVRASGDPLVIREALALVMIGIVLGSAGGVVVSRLATLRVAGLLPDVDPRDPLAFAAAVAILTTVAGIAAYLPARRASLIQPMDAVRAD